MSLCRRDAYTVIAPDEDKRKMIQESKMSICFKNLKLYIASCDRVISLKCEISSVVFCFAEASNYRINYVITLNWIFIKHLLM